MSKPLTKSSRQAMEESIAANRGYIVQSVIWVRPDAPRPIFNEEGKPQLERYLLCPLEMLPEGTLEEMHRLSREKALQSTPDEREDG